MCKMTYCCGPLVLAHLAISKDRESAVHKNTLSDLCPQVDDLEEYLSDPVKQHLLVRALPARMKRQLLYRR